MNTSNTRLGAIAENLQEQREDASRVTTIELAERAPIATRHAGDDSGVGLGVGGSLLEIVLGHVAV